MLGDMWSSSELTAEKLGITEIKLSFLRENGILKPGIHWKSSPLGQKKPWKPKALYNCLLYTSPSPRDLVISRMPSSA